MARSKDIPFSEDTANANYAEFSVTPKPDKEIKTKRFLLVLLYSVFSIAYCTAFLVIWQMAPLVAMLPLLVLVMWILTWRYTKIEYAYIVERGQLHIYRVNGFGRAKEVFTAKVSENLGIIPAGDVDGKKLLESCTASYDYSIGSKSEDRYVAVFAVEGKNTAIYFTAASKLLSVLRYYGGERVLVTYVSR